MSASLSLYHENLASSASLMQTFSAQSVSSAAISLWWKFALYQLV